MNRYLALFCIALCLHAATTQPLYGFEKALLYSFEDPSDIEWVAPRVEPGRDKRRGRLLNLMGQNNRFLEPYLKKKEEKELKAKIQAEKAAAQKDCLIHQD